MLKDFDQSGPVRAGAWWRGDFREGRKRIGLFRHQVKYALRGTWPDAGQKLHETKAGHAVARILYEAQHRQHVLDVGAVEEFKAAELHERNVSSGQLHFERSAVM